MLIATMSRLLISILETITNVAMIKFVLMVFGLLIKAGGRKLDSLRVTQYYAIIQVCHSTRVSFAMINPLLTIRHQRLT